ncbi:two-component regulator propeller domain-containing protein [Postechiella marina]|uniref:histidine kinase n=1 Tax=Postechiella marina TaxID=943941 RepID=A0ABP8BYU8_9FLAO
MLKVKLFVFFLICVFNSHSQNAVGFEHLSTENGLSQNDVNTIYQDELGYMWFGTHDGLNRYDGYKFTVFKPEPNNPKSISSILVWDIAPNKGGDFWVATTGQGLNYYHSSTENFTRFKHNKEDSSSLASDHVSSIFKDSKNRLWIGTNQGIDVIDTTKPLDSVTFKHLEIKIPNYLSKESTNYYCIFEDSNNQIWAGGNQGLFKLTKNQKGEDFFKLVNHLIGLPNMPVRSLAEDNLNRLIIGSGGGLYSYYPYGIAQRVRWLSGGFFKKIITDNNYIWGAKTDGLLYYKTGKRKDPPVLINNFRYNPNNPATSLSNNLVSSLYQDRSGIVWVGVDGGGVNKFNPEIKQFKLIQKTGAPNSLTGNNIRTIFEDSNKTLWIGTEGNGLNMQRYGENENHFTSIGSSQFAFDLSEITIAGKKKLLIGSQGSIGLFELDITDPKKEFTNKDVKQLSNISSSVFSVLTDSSKNIWIGTYNSGVHRWLATDVPGEYKKDNLFYNIHQKNSISNDIIRDIIEDEQGNIWFATAKGLSKLPKDEINKKNPQFIVYKNNPDDAFSLSYDYILTVFQSKSGDIWLGTFGGGLNKLVTTKDNKVKFISFSEKQGLPNNVVKSILEDNHGNLWLSTNKGLSKFNIEDKTFKNYDVNDGLQSHEFGEVAAFKRKNGEMLFGGVNGFNKFFPEKIKDNSTLPETVITNFSIFNKPVGIGKEIGNRVILKQSINNTKKIDLKYKENSFSFEFASLHYAAPSKNQFAYKLEGFDKDWIYTKADMRFATYTNLESGLYTLKVKASNNDGIWDETPVELQINVTPPFYRTNLAILIYIMLFIMGLFAFRRFTIIGSSKKHKLELDVLEKGQQEQIQQLKLEFFTNISHEFRTPLTLIKGPIEYLLKKGPNVKPEKAKEQYQLMLKNTDYLLRLVNQLLDYRKMDKGKMELTVSQTNIVEFIREIGEPFQFLSSKNNINFNIKSEAELITTWIDPDAIEKVINNLLSNAFKFTPKGGSISLNIFRGQNFEVPDGFKTKIDKANYTIIQVKDTGKGIPKNKLDLIFERFYSEKGSKKSKYEGSGIGLSFAKKLIELHQGSIDVVSNATDGSNFIIWIPRYKETYENINGIGFRDATETYAHLNQLNEDSHAIGLIDEIVEKNISKTRSKLPALLIVDDSADIRLIIRNGLEDLYDIYEAENGERGFELAKKILPNVILTDVLMPVMGGIEFCDKLKNAQETSHIPVVMLTAKISQEWEIEGLKTGADAYIRKPFNMEVLELKLNNIVKQRDKLRKRFNREITLQPKEITVTSVDETFLKKAIEIVEKHMMNTEFSVEFLVKEMNLSRSNLYLKLKELTGLTSGEFIRNIRLKRAVQLLKNSDLSVKEIMYMTGFNTASYFSKCFKKQFGVIPSKFIRNEESSSKEEDQEEKNKPK